MNKKKIMIVFGTRPEAIKMAPIVHALKAENKYFDVKVCVTSQHKQMLKQVLDIFKIKPDIDLKIMKSNQDLFNLSSTILTKMKKIFNFYKPDIVLVHGDTTTTFVTSVAAFYCSISIGHIEAGLRTYKINSPFPEEFNRQITSKIARWHFAPTLQNKKNLLSEGIKNSSIKVTGNTVIDSLKWILKRINDDKNQIKNVKKKLDKILSFNFIKEKFILITAHRRENFGHGIIEICSAIRKLALAFPDIYFVYPVHLNPNVKKPVKRILDNISNIKLIEPLEYKLFIYLMKNSYLVLTDSGGLQEEAPSFGKPVLVMRNVTERIEAIKSKTVKLVGTDQNNIIKGVSLLLKNEKYYKLMSRANNPYGDGLACKRIVDSLKKNLLNKN